MRARQLHAVGAPRRDGQPNVARGLRAGEHRDPGAGECPEPAPAVSVRGGGKELRELVAGSGWEVGRLIEGDAGIYVAVLDKQSVTTTAIA